MGRLTTHILDTTRGGAANGVALRLYRCGKHREQIADATTNADGRTDQALLEDDTMLSGTYELEFDIGDYFRAHGAITSKPAFLDTVIIRFFVNGDEQYHVPLLCSPWSYSTYRGS